MLWGRNAGSPDEASGVETTKSMASLVVRWPRMRRESGRSAQMVPDRGTDEWYAESFPTFYERILLGKIIYHLMLIS